MSRRRRPRPASTVPADLFHPAVSNWLHGRFGGPTGVQATAWAEAAAGKNVLVAAPTGSGKTLAAFLSAINALVEEALRGGGLADETHILYVSPLKALSNDIRKNLQEPLAGIRSELEKMGLPDVGIRDAVRTGDTPAAERETMRRRPPHILVTTPESLFILLTSDSGRAMLRSVRSVIVDELHAVAGTKRGAHLMLSLERLGALCEREPARIGLSATVKPLEEVARFLVGSSTRPLALVDAGHVRERDIALEVPPSPLTAVMSTEVWGEVYDRLAALALAHRTTLVFVNQRRTAERVARHLAERLGEEQVCAHHGSLAREHRLRAEQRLKAGELTVLVATSSLELGIDIGDVDLVCQLGSPRSINAFLQRVGRAGHAVGAVPKGRLFALTLDDLLECTALLDAVRHRELDRIRLPARPLDVLAQQLVAEVACREWPLDALHAQFCRALPYAGLALRQFEQVVEMLADGYATSRGRRGALVHYDAVNRVVRGRKGAKLTAVTNAGVIPDQFDYEVVLLPEGHKVGTLNEDFAFESIPGDIFQLGNQSYRIAKIETGKVLVEDARGQPPSMPFWFGEGVGRSDELSDAVSRLSETLAEQLEAGIDACQRWVEDALSLAPAAAAQLVSYLAAAKAALGVLPSKRRIVFERFFDEIGDTHLVIHSPYGSRLNRAWGLALRKRFCRKFNFELQASALDDSIILSLGPTHSFPLDEVRRYLHSATARDILTQALLDAPMFGTRWRWAATAALAVRRMSGGRRVLPQFQRSDAEDLLTMVFPDQVACAENLIGEREIPEHPLVAQTLADCLHESMDCEGFVALIARIESGEVEVATRDLTSPSPLAQAVLNARPYAFLDDGAAEERRTKAVRSQSFLDVDAAASLATLPTDVIDAVCQEAMPDIGSPDELHDALVLHAFLTTAEAGHPEFVDALIAQRRATRLQAGGDNSGDYGADDDSTRLVVAAERLHEFLEARPGAVMSPPIAAVRVTAVEPHEALKHILRSRLELLGPVRSDALGAPMGLTAADVLPSLLTLEAEGTVMRGPFRCAGVEEWCDRRLLARMHRRTRDRLRADVRPVAPADYLRFLFRWHRIVGAAEEGDRREGDLGLVAALEQLQGVGVSAGAWEEDLLPARVRDYSGAMLDRLCATGRFAWRRQPGGNGARKTGPARSTPVLLGDRESLGHWRSFGESDGADANASSADAEVLLSAKAAKVLEALRTHGATFFSDLRSDVGMLAYEVEQALGELVAQGLVTCDTFSGLRVLVMPAERRKKLARRAQDGLGFDGAGRWTLMRPSRLAAVSAGALADPTVEHIARVLLQRYGVVFRAVLEKEENLPPWRELHYVYRRLEARGEVRGGRFVSGFSGEQFALPEAAGALRAAANATGIERVSVSAVDPLNLVGVLTPGEKVPRLQGNRILFENGVPIVIQSAGELQFLREVDPRTRWELQMLIVRVPRPLAPLHGAAIPA